MLWQIAIMPNHTERYARAWDLYRSEGLSDEAKIILEREMDEAQNSFSFDEFQEFKKTLPGFCEYWESIKTDTRGWPPVRPEDQGCVFGEDCYPREQL